MTNSEIATYLRDEGFEFSNQLHEENREYFSYINSSYYSIASAIALCWTKHAKFEDGFIEYAAPYIDGTVVRDNKIPIKYCNRFGAEELDIALLNYRKFYNRIKVLMPDFNTCSIQDINKLQTRLLNQLDIFRNNGEVSYIGPWLFLGPFKIILGDQKRFWNNEGLNSIVLPTGIEVNRGIIRLKNKGYTFMKDFDRHWLEEGKGSLLNSYATCNMVHTHIIKVAELAKTSALHINSALYQYGREDI